MIDIEKLKTFGKGTWEEINSYKKDPENFDENLKRLMKIFVDTDICLKNEKNAKQIIKDGEANVYVFFDNNGKPRIVADIDDFGLMNGFRGTDLGKEQVVNKEYYDVALEFLQNIEGRLCADLWQEDFEWRERMESYITKFQNHDYKNIKVTELIKDLATDSFNLHKVKESTIKKELKKEPMLKPIIAKYLGCTTREICIGNYSGEGLDYKYIIGNCYSSYINPECKNLIIFGNFISPKYKEDALRPDPTVVKVIGKIDIVGGKEHVLEQTESTKKTNIRDLIY